MEQLIGKACGCVRLLLIYTPGLMQLLGLLNLMDCVWTPPSIETAKCDAIETVAYSGTCVGELVKWCQKHFEKHPEELTPDLDAEFGPNGRDDTEPFIKIKVKPALDALKTFQDWQNKVHRWREDTSELNVLCVLVTSDILLARKKFDPDNENALVVDASHRDDLDHLDEHFAQLSQGLSHRHRKSEASGSDSLQSPSTARSGRNRQRHVMVVMLNAHYLPSQKVATIVARCVHLTQPTYKLAAHLKVLASSDATTTAPEF